METLVTVEDPTVPFAVLAEEALPRPLMNLLSVVSRKTHGAAGAFDIALDMAQAIGGLVTVEPRILGSGHKIIFTFDQPILSAGSVSSLDSLGAAFGSASAAAVGNTIEVTITGAPDIKRAVISLTGVNGAIAVVINTGFLVGDQNNSRSVTGTDIGIIRGRNGQAVTSVNFRSDVSVDGLIQSSSTGGPDVDYQLAGPNSGQAI